MIEAYAIEIGVACIVAIALIVAILVCAPLRRRPCRWQRLRRHDRAAMRCWTCRRCGEEAWASGRHPPRECKRPLRTAL